MKTIIFPILLAVSASPAFADFCDYRPSQLIGDSGAGAVETAGVATVEQAVFGNLGVGNQSL